jgi:uncharacterized protein DUF6493
LQKSHDETFEVMKHLLRLPIAVQYLPPPRHSAYGVFKILSGFLLDGTIDYGCRNPRRSPHAGSSCLPSPFPRRIATFAAALDTLAWNLDWWQAAWQNKTLLEPLLDPGTPLCTMGLLLLATALAAKEPGEHGLATDIAIRAIEEGRLGSDNLGLVLAQLLPTGVIKPVRWQKTLADVARASPVHALVVQRALQSSPRDTPEKLARDFAKLLELLYDLSIELNQHLGDEGCRAFLQQLSSGKSGKVAKDLLNLPATDFSTTGRPILFQAIKQRAAAEELFGSSSQGSRI